MDKIKDNHGPVITIDVDWGTPDPVPMVEGVLIVQVNDGSTSGNGCPTYRVTASLVNLVHWVAEHYICLDKGTAHTLADSFLSAEFAKISTAFDE